MKKFLLNLSSFYVIIYVYNTFYLLFRHKAGEAMGLVIHKIFGWIPKFFKRCFNRKELFTLMIVPHAPLKSVKSVKFPKWIVSSFVIINIVILGVVCTFAMSYYSLNKNLDAKNTEYQALQDDKANDEKQLDKYKANEQEIKDRIETLKDLEDKVNDIIKSKGAAPQSNSSVPKLASRGGPVSEQLMDNKSFDTEPQTITDLLGSVDTLVEEVNQKEAELNSAIKQEQDRILALRAIPSVFPVNGTITSRFAYRKNPFGSGYEFHTGVDIANSKGTPIKAAADGVVIEAGWNSGGYGNLVMIDHGNGYVSLYGHNSKIAVKVGQRVERGQVISYMGSTGRSTGNHCHFEIRYHGKPIDPYSIKQ